MSELDEIEDQLPARRSRIVLGIALQVAGVALLFLGVASDNGLLQWPIPFWVGGGVIGVGWAIRRYELR